MLPLTFLRSQQIDAECSDSQTKRFLHKIQKLSYSADIKLQHKFHSVNIYRFSVLLCFFPSSLVCVTMSEKRKQMCASTRLIPKAPSRAATPTLQGSNFCGCMCMEKILFRFFPEKSYKDNLFSLFSKCTTKQQERKVFFPSSESLKRDLKQLKLLPSRPGRRERQFTGGYSQEIARIFGASESS